MEFSKFNKLVKVIPSFKWTPVEGADPFVILEHEGETYVRFPKWDPSGESLHEELELQVKDEVRIVKELHRSRKCRIARVEFQKIG